MIVRIRYWILVCTMLDGSSKEMMHFTSQDTAETFVRGRNQSYLDLLGIKEMKPVKRYMIGEIEDELS